MVTSYPKPQPQALSEDEKLLHLATLQISRIPGIVASLNVMLFYDKT